MKIIVTGSLGHISLPLTKRLIAEGHSVTVISSKAERRAAIEQLGAQAAIGSVLDIPFLTSVFEKADAVYAMNPPDYKSTDQTAYYTQVGESFAAAIKKTGIKRVVYLSSYGAHLPSGTGYITGSYKTEKILNEIPGLLLTHARPTSFYYNFLSFIPMIKAAGFMGTVYGGEDLLPMVSPLDIADAVAEEIVKTKDAERVRYVCSDEMTCNEIAKTLGAAIGKPDLEWKILPAEQVKKALLSNGMAESAAHNLIELGETVHSGLLRQEYDLHKPVFGKIKLIDYAKEFAATFKNA